MRLIRGTYPVLLVTFKTLPLPLPGWAMVAMVPVPPTGPAGNASAR